MNPYNIEGIQSLIQETKDYIKLLKMRELINKSNAYITEVENTLSTSSELKTPNVGDLREDLRNYVGVPRAMSHCDSHVTTPAIIHENLDLIYLFLEDATKDTQSSCGCFLA